MRFWNAIRVPMALLWLAGAGFIWWKWGGPGSVVLPMFAPMVFTPAALMLSGNAFTMTRLSSRLLLGNSLPKTERARSRARDLWLAGVTGRVAVEAAYLEAAQRARQLPAILGIMLPAVPTLIGFFGLSNSPRAVVIGVVGIAAFVFVGGPALAEFERLIRVRMLQVRVECWPKPISVARDFRMTLSLIGASIPFSLCNMLIIMPPMIVVMTSFVTRRMTAPSATALFVRENWTGLEAVWLLLVAIMLRAVTPWLRRVTARRWIDVITNADTAFRTFFLRVLMDDPDV